MPIENLTTRAALQPRYPILGKWRKGGPQGPDGQVGEDLPYFRFVPRRGNQSAEIAAAVARIYGPEPDSLKVRFPLPLMGDVFSSWRESYTQSRLLRMRCNGREIVYWLEGHIVRHGRRPCTLDCYDPDNRCPGCKVMPVGRLSVIMEPLWQEGFIGLVTVETHGITDLLNIGGALVTNEPLTGKVFRLFRKPQTVGAPLKKEGRRIAVEKWMVDLELDREWALLEMARQEQQAQARYALVAQASRPVNEAEPESASPADPYVPAPFFEVDEPPIQGEFYEGGPPPPPESEPPPPPESTRRPASAAPAPPPPSASGPRLDRENRPQEGDGWTTFYQWAMDGGYTRDAAFGAVKAYHPDATARKMCSVSEAVGALLAEEDYRLSGGENDVHDESGE